MTPRNPASDAALLRSLLGPTPPDCHEASPGNRTCGRLLASTARLVEYVAAALKDMPKTAEYEKVSTAVAEFRQSYESIEKTGCYTRQGKALATEKTLRDLCTTFASVVALAWLNLREAIGDLERAG
jgi:hypothetical protein